MAKRVGRPKKPGGEGKHVRLNADMVSKAKIVSLRQGLNLGDYLSGLLDAHVNRDYQCVLKELASKEGGEK